jgi:hypothetical protein
MAFGFDPHTLRVRTLSIPGVANHVRIAIEFAVAILGGCPSSITAWVAPPRLYNHTQTTS